MTIREHIEEIRRLFCMTMPGVPCEEVACLDCREDRHILKAIDAALAATQWRSMDSAPRDGASVLVVCGGVVMEASDYGDDEAGHFWMSGEWRVNPTHWMPLPEATKEGE